MDLNYFDQQSRRSYSSRKADKSWVNRLEGMLEVAGKKVVDTGCGGGIYTKAFADMGARHVTGVDFSKEMLSAAKEHCEEYEQIDFQLGHALQTGLEASSCDIIFERALIHHLKSTDLMPAMNEAYRVLKPGGRLIIQDRTPEDCLLSGSATHIRGYFFSMFPRLVDYEKSRRHQSNQVILAIQKAGFTGIEEKEFWETRKKYDNLKDLQNDLSSRTGRSILHELTDSEVACLVRHISNELRDRTDEKISEKDRWTIWMAQK